MARNKKTSESLFKFMNLLIALLMKNGQYRLAANRNSTGMLSPGGMGNIRY